jgi:hypothetical protein
MAWTQATHWSLNKASIMKTILITTAALTACAMAQGQSFVNLDFESPVSPLAPVNSPFPNSVQASRALPGWSVLTSAGTNSWVLYNDASLTPYASASLYSASAGSGHVIGGQYSVLLFSGLQYPTVSTPTGSSTALAQTGLVPEGSLSLRLAIVGSAVDVSLGGTSLPLVPLGMGTNNVLRYSMWGADVSAFAGLSEELRITVPYSGEWPFGIYNSLLIDSIAFSPNPIPEPGTWSLLVLGAAAWLVAKGRRRRGRRCSFGWPWRGFRLEV